MSGDRRGAAGSGPSAPGDEADEGRAAALARVRAVLQAAGVGEEEFQAALAGDVVDLLVADRLLLPTRRRFTAQEVAEATGMAVDVLARFWRALGFPDFGPEERLFGEQDVEAVLTLQELVDLGVTDLASAVGLTRVVGVAMSRVAEAELAATATPLGTAGGDSVEAAARFVEVADRSLPAVARLLEFVWRRHLQAAVRRAMAQRGRQPSGSPELVVGFADMVGFTRLSQQLDEATLATVVNRFETLAHETITALGGRLVKMIGDEAMFVAERPGAGVAVAVRLAELYADDELLSDVRVGLALGPVLAQDGDYFGPVVNLASRIAQLAYPGTVLAADEVRHALVAEQAARDLPAAVQAVLAEVEATPLRPRMVRDVGRVQLWNLHRRGQEAAPSDRRAGRRLDRLAGVLRDLEGLRGLGEQVLAARRPEGDPGAPSSSGSPGR
jgi:adenylate cyclase